MGNETSFHSLLPTPVACSGLTEQKRLVLAALQRIRVLYFYILWLWCPQPLAVCYRSSEGLLYSTFLTLRQFSSFLHISARESRPSSFALRSSFMRVLHCDAANSARNWRELFSQDLLKDPRKPLKMKVHFPCTAEKGGKRSHKQGLKNRVWL